MTRKNCFYLVTNFGACAYDVNKYTSIRTLSVIHLNISHTLRKYDNNNRGYCVNKNKKQIFTYLVMIVESTKSIKTIF